MKINLKKKKKAWLPHQRAHKRKNESEMVTECWLLPFSRAESIHAQWPMTQPRSHLIFSLQCLLVTFLYTWNLWKKWLPFATMWYNLCETLLSLWALQRRNIQTTDIVTEFFSVIAETLLNKVFSKKSETKS